MFSGVNSAAGRGPIRLSPRIDASGVRRHGHIARLSLVSNVPVGDIGAAVRTASRNE